MYSDWYLRKQFQQQQKMNTATFRLSDLVVDYISLHLRSRDVIDLPDQIYLQNLKSPRVMRYMTELLSRIRQHCVNTPHGHRVMNPICFMMAFFYTDKMAVQADEDDIVTKVRVTARSLLNTFNDIMRSLRGMDTAARFDRLSPGLTDNFMSQYREFSNAHDDFIHHQRVVQIQGVLTQLHARRSIHIAQGAVDVEWLASCDAHIVDLQNRLNILSE